MARATATYDDLAEAVERQVRSMTFGQVRELHVETTGGVVILRGRVDTYYLKQIAQHAALEVVSDCELLNEILVVSLPSLTSP